MYTERGMSSVQETSAILSMYLIDGKIYYFIVKLKNKPRSIYFHI